MCIKISILFKYQNLYTTKCQTQLREREIQNSVTKTFSYRLHHIFIHRVTQKSPRNGQMVSLFTQRALCGYHSIAITSSCVSPLTENWDGVIRAHASLMRSFRWSIFCSFTWYTMDFKWLTSKNQVGWGLQTSDATPRDRGEQSNYLETAALTNGARRHNILLTQIF